MYLINGLKNKRMIMKNIAKYLILLIFIGLVPVHADGPARWQVKDNDTIIYVYGTIHVLKPELKWQTPGMIADFDKANQIIFELAPDQLTPQVMQPLLFSKGLFGPEDSLTHYLDEGTYKLLSAHLSGAGMPDTMISQMKPWFAGMMLAQVAYASQGFTGEIGVEKMLSQRAVKNAQHMRGLETAGQQIDYFATMPMDEQLSFLQISIEDFDKAGEQINDMLDAWIKGDIESLGSLLNESMADLPNVYERLITQRNKNWVTQIKGFMQEPGIFFMAVGAGHMSGDVGIITLLKKAGYEVRRVE